jgi:diguanylate cyclase (GGDEF)-like protein
MIGARRLGERQQRLHHARDLALVGPPGAADRALDLLRGVIGAPDAALARGQKHHTACLADGKSCANVLTEIQCFKRDGIRPVLVEQLAQARVQRRQAALGRQPGRRPDDAAVDGDQPIPTANDDAEAAIGEAGIDAEDHHPNSILRTWPDTFRTGPYGRMSGARLSVHRLNENLHGTDDALVLLWADRHELRRALARAHARLAGLEAQLADLARTDDRTGLLTLDAFRGDAEAVLGHAAGAEQPASLALVDIDHFRSLNARRGQAAGDAALRAVADRLKALTRVSDVLGRTGADEVAVLMPGTTLAGASACCERLIAGLEGADIPGAGFITVSAGVATHRPGTTVERLLAAAGRGLDRARSDGGARTAARPAEGGVDPFRAQAHVIDALATALVERDRYTGEHSAFVVEMAKTVATALGLDEVEVERVGHAALLHDIGKVGVPDRILHKAGPLAGEEWVVMREHPVIGERILRAIPGMGGVARMVRHEHEWFDGSGYPDGLVGERIPLGSRIILACDAYHAMTSDRSYRAAMPHADAVAELVRCSGTQFDPRVIAALVGYLGQGEPRFMMSR